MSPDTSMHSTCMHCMGRGLGDLCDVAYGSSLEIWWIEQQAKGEFYEYIACTFRNYYLLCLSLPNDLPKEAGYEWH